MMGDDEIEHEILGRMHRDSGEWVTEAVVITCLNCTLPLSIHDDKEVPSQHQMAILSALLTAPEAFRDELAGRLYEAYLDSRPAYVATIGDGLTLDDLPELESGGEVWKVLGTANRIAMYEDDLSIEFPTKFDVDHESIVVIREGEFYEVSVGGG
jgi:hypothetical protein